MSYIGCHLPRYHYSQCDSILAKYFLCSQMIFWSSESFIALGWAQKTLIIHFCKVSGVNNNIVFIHFDWMHLFGRSILMINGIWKIILYYCELFWDLKTTSFVYINFCHEHFGYLLQISSNYYVSILYIY